MNSTDKERLTKEAAEIAERFQAAAKNPTELTRLRAQYGERLIHIRGRLEMAEELEAAAAVIDPAAEPKAAPEKPVAKPKG